VLVLNSFSILLFSRSSRSSFFFFRKRRKKGREGGRERWREKCEWVLGREKVKEGTGRREGGREGGREGRGIYIDICPSFITHLLLALLYGSWREGERKERRGLSMRISYW